MAEKKAYALMGEFSGGDTFDHVNVVMKDTDGNIWINLVWDETE